MGSEERVEDIRKLWSNESVIDFYRIEELGNRIIMSWNSGGKLAFGGNGGSAAEASHLAAEFVGKCVINHDPWPAICLNESISALTAISNDFGFDQVLLRQSKALLRRGDVIIGLSTSGASRNVLDALTEATDRGIYSILWTSERFSKLAQYSINEIWIAPTLSTPRAQEVHLTWGHLLSEYLESTFEK
jgi:D-sedoheptulose 7-phosphate isomerase